MQQGQSRHRNGRRGRRARASLHLLGAERKTVPRCHWPAASHVLVPRPTKPFLLAPSRPDEPLPVRPAWSGPLLSTPFLGI